MVVKTWLLIHQTVTGSGVVQVSAEWGAGWPKQLVQGFEMVLVRHQRGREIHWTR